MVVDARGLPIRLGLTAGQTRDGQMADTRVATRYDKLATNFLAMVQLAQSGCGFALTSLRPSQSCFRVGSAAE